MRPWVPVHHSSPWVWIGMCVPPSIAGGYREDRLVQIETEGWREMVGAKGTSVQRLPKNLRPASGTRAGGWLCNTCVFCFSIAQTKLQHSTYGNETRTSQSALSVKAMSGPRDVPASELPLEEMILTDSLSHMGSSCEKQLCYRKYLFCRGPNIVMP